MTPPPIAMSFMEKDFLEEYEVAVSGGTMCLRASWAGSFKHPQKNIERFVRKYCDSIGRSDAFSKDLVERFKSYLEAGAEPLAPDQLLTY